MISVYYDDTIMQKVFRIKGGGTQTPDVPTYQIVASDMTVAEGTISYTARLLYNHEPVSGASITFSCGGEEESDDTDNDGYATVTFMLSEGTYSIVMTAMGTSATKTITVYEVHNYSISLSASSQTVSVDSQITITATLTDSDTPVPNASVGVSISKDGSILDGEFITTDSNGVATFTYAPSVMGSYTFTFSYDVVDSNVSVTVNKINTSLDIDVPLVLVYGDDFNITGTLTDTSNSAVSGKTVKLKVGSTIVDTGTTNSSGIVSFTQTPVTTGNHSFQLVFEGDYKYTNVDSSIVSRVVGKETTVLTVTTPINNSQIYVGGSVSISGNLLTDDGEALSGKSIVVSESGTTLTTLTTGSDGGFSGSLSGLSVGSHSLEFKFVTDTYYTASSVTRTVNVVDHTYSLSLTGSSIIETGDTDTITATLLMDGVAYSGVTLDYEVKKGTTVLDSGTTSATDSLGQTTITYIGTGAGDVDVIVSKSSMSLQETYVIYDCLFGDDMTIADTNKFTMTGQVQYNEHNSNGWKYGAVDGLLWIDLNNYILSEPVSIEYTVSEAYSGPTGNYAPLMVYFENPSQSRVYVVQANKFFQMNSSTKQNQNISLGSEYRIEYTGNTVKLYLGDTLLGSANHSLGTSNIKVRLASGGNRYCRLKNFKIKAL